MEGTLPCRGCRGLCCGPVAVTEPELKKIKKSVKTMPQKLRAALRSQERAFGTCIFYDAVRDQCGIYTARPEACKQFGYYKGMVCFRNPELATKPLPDGRREQPAGILSVDFTWKDFN
jgi:uncharacterized protein